MIGKRNRKRFLFLFVLLSAVACSPGSRQLFFDIPPPSEEELAAEEAGQKSARSDDATRQTSYGNENYKIVAESLPRPAIESVLSWEVAQAELPEHEHGGVDWPDALEQGLVRPRTWGDPSASAASAFKYDFVIQGSKPKFNAIFPHSAHTGWLGCNNCHPALFPYKRNLAKMKDMRQGASCGACHGKVAFSLRQCKRCHLEM